MDRCEMCQFLKGLENLKEYFRHRRKMHPPEVVHE